MANLTITVDDDLLHRARVSATEQGTSVNAILRDELVRFAGANRPGNPIDEFIAVARAHPGASGAGGHNWTRDELHLERLTRKSQQPGR